MSGAVPNRAEILGATADDGSVVLELLPADWRDVLARGLNRDPLLRPDDADLLLAELRGGGRSNGLFGDFEPNDELDGRFVVKSEAVSEGGIARVYQV